MPPVTACEGHTPIPQGLATPPPGGTVHRVRYTPSQCNTIHPPTGGGPLPVVVGAVKLGVPPRRPPTTSLAWAGTLGFVLFLNVCPTESVPFIDFLALQAWARGIDPKRLSQAAAAMTAGLRQAQACQLPSTVSGRSDHGNLLNSHGARALQVATARAASTAPQRRGSQGVGVVTAALCVGLGWLGHGRVTAHGVQRSREGLRATVTVQYAVGESTVTAHDRATARRECDTVAP